MTTDERLERIEAQMSRLRRAVAAVLADLVKDEENTNVQAYADEIEAEMGD